MIDETEKQLMKLVKNEYYGLKMLYPGHDLLKYVFLDEDEVLPNRRITSEFVSHFCPDMEDFARKNNVSIKECQKILFLASFRNYYDALEEAIEDAEKRINLN